jgi:cytoskeletal protein RodZ
MNTWTTSNAEVKREFGSLLRRARESQGLTVADVSEQTRIPSRYIQLLEEEAFDKLTQPFYVRNYINNLSKFYGIDPRPLLAFYESLSGYAPPNLSPDAYSTSAPAAPVKAKTPVAAPPPPAAPQARPTNASSIKVEPVSASGPGPKTIPRRPLPTGITVNKNSGNPRELSTAAWLIFGILTIAVVLGLVWLLSTACSGGFKQPPAKNAKPAAEAAPAKPPAAKTSVAGAPATEKTAKTGTELMERFIYPEPFPPTTLKIPPNKGTPATTARSSH